MASFSQNKDGDRVLEPERPTAAVLKDSQVTGRSPTGGSSITRAVSAPIRVPSQHSWQRAQMQLSHVDLRALENSGKMLGPVDRTHLGNGVPRWAQSGVKLAS